MRIQLMSDLHLEFDGDYGRNFLSTLDPYGVDVLVLAGDIIIPNQMYTTLSNICDLYKTAEVLYVLGNHDCIHMSLRDVRKILKDVAVVHHNFTWLEDDIKTITVSNTKGEMETKRFLGCTMWYPPTEAAQVHKRGWFDFCHIKNADPFIFIQNKKSRWFLKENIQKGDIVITHMLPSFLSVSPKYAGDVTNCFFVCDMEETIKEKEPLLWLHGHTHNSFDYKINQTRVLCNPRGYIRSRDLNPKFDTDLVVETTKEVQI